MLGSTAAGQPLVPDLRRVDTVRAATRPGCLRRAAAAHGLAATAAGGG